MGKTYNVSRVIDKKHDFSFNITKYEEYSEVCFPFPDLLGPRADDPRSTSP